MKTRIVFYDAKLITEQIGSGDEYDNIHKVISIIITEESLIPGSQRYHHRFTLYDPKAGVEFSDIVEIHTIELRKLPVSSDGTSLYDWAKFIDAELRICCANPSLTEEELYMISERNPQVGRAVVKLRELSADERARDLLERREKGRRDYVDFMNGARAEGLAKGRAEGLAEGHGKGLAEGRADGLAEGLTEGLAKGLAKGLAEGRADGLAEGRADVARNLLKMNLSVEQIISASGLTREEVEALA